MWSAQLSSSLKRCLHCLDPLIRGEKSTQSTETPTDLECPYSLNVQILASIENENFQTSSLGLSLGSTSSIGNFQQLPVHNQCEC